MEHTQEQEQYFNWINTQIVQMTRDMSKKDALELIVIYFKKVNETLKEKIKIGDRLKRLLSLTLSAREAAENFEWVLKTPAYSATNNGQPIPISQL